LKVRRLDIWQTAPNGMYSSQDPDQDTYSFHGIQTTGKDGRYGFTTVKPISYTVPSDGPVGDILRASGRHPWRPSHLHYIIKAGFRPLVTEIFSDDDPYLDEDTVFGVRDDLIMTYVEKPAGKLPSRRLRTVRQGRPVPTSRQLRPGSGPGVSSIATQHKGGSFGPPFLHLTHSLRAGLPLSTRQLLR
jgi:protocatechuate 3,4-dioxygenase beta subunit